jgi:signal transduction histidine kinase
MIGLGIQRAKSLADESNANLAAALDATARLSRSAMWEMRGPIDTGHILEGRELGHALWSHCATFEKITGVPARMTKHGTEPPLATQTRSRLFAIAHNALTNAFLHA